VLEGAGHVEGSLARPDVALDTCAHFLTAQRAQKTPAACLITKGNASHCIAQPADAQNKNLTMHSTMHVDGKEG